MKIILKAGIPTADFLPPAEPIDRVARRVTGKGEHHMFANPTDEICSPTPLPIRDIPNMSRRDPCFVDLTSRRAGHLVVIGLATITNNASIDAVNPVNKKANALGRKHPNGYTRWVCRCDCGNYLLRSPKAINRGIPEGLQCFQCWKLEGLRNDKDRKGRQPITGAERDATRGRSGS